MDSGSFAILLVYIEPKHMERVLSLSLYADILKDIVRIHGCLPIHNADSSMQHGDERMQSYRSFHEHEGGLVFLSSFCTGD
jgi:hypothetical protein